MVETVNFIIAFIICVVECIYFILILPRDPVKVEKTDTMRSVNQSKEEFINLLSVLCLVTIILSVICILNELIILEIYIGDVIVYLLIGAPTIINRIEIKENMIKEE